MAARKKGGRRKSPRPQNEREPSPDGTPTPDSPADDSPPADAASVFAALGKLAPEPEGEPDKGGRPPIPIDLQKLGELLRWNCTDEEIAADLGISVRTLERRKQTDEVVRAMFETSHARGRRSLKRTLWGLALRANDEEPPRGAVSALIFLCKQPPHRGGLGMSGGAGLGDDGLGPFDVDAARDELLERLERLAPPSSRGRGKAVSA